MNDTQTQREDPEHREVWLHLPWYVNDSVDQRQRERIETHLRSCAACRDELLQQSAIHSAISADTGIEILPSASLGRLRQRLDAQAPIAAAAEVKGTRLRLLAAASIAGLAVALGALMWRTTPQPDAGKSNDRYRTVSSESPRPAQESIRAVFAAETTMARLQNLLDASQLKIVAGPSEAGVYSLALTGNQQVTSALRQLRQRPEVRFAESTVPAPARNDQ